MGMRCTDMMGARASDLRVVGAIIVTAVAWVTGPVAYARCAPAEVFASPPSGSILPENPVLYVFAPGKEEPKVSAKAGRGRKVKTEIALLPSPPAFSVYAVRLDVQAQTQVLVEVKERRRPGHVFRGRYRVQAASAKSDAKVEVLSQESISNHWTCSHTEVAQLEVKDWAPAYEVRWASSTEALAHEEAARVVLPPNMGAFFGLTNETGGTNETIGTKGTRAGAALELGHVSCLGQTFELTGSTFVRISGLGSDGHSTGPSEIVRVEPPPHEGPPAPRAAGGPQ